MRLFDKLFKGKWTDDSIHGKGTKQSAILTPVKDNIPEERKKKFTGVWDSRRLLHELIAISSGEIEEIYKIQLRHGLSEDIASFKIRCKRLLSIINAFNGWKGRIKMNDYILLQDLIHENCSGIEIQELASLLGNFVSESYKSKMNTIYNSGKDYTGREEYIRRMHLFRFLFPYKFKTYKLLLCEVDELETNIAGKRVADTIRKSCNERIENINETLDKLLLLLLGDGYDKIFTEKELLEDYDYPNVTDEELHEMDLEYC